MTDRILSMKVLARYRAGWRPTLAEKIASITDPFELDGVADQLAREGKYTDDNRALVATRRAEIAREARR